MIRRAFTFIAAVAVAYIVASALATMSVMGSLTGMGIRIGFGTGLAMVAHDIAGMASSLLPLIVIGFLIAFLLTSLLTRWWPAIRTALYCIAGAVAVISIHAILHLTFDITPVAAARSTVGLLLQGFAGAVGGYLYARFSLPRAAGPV